MEQRIVSTAYAPLQPPYQIIKYDQDVAMQIGTLIVTVQKGTKGYQIETHSHPVVAYEDKSDSRLAEEQLTDHQFLEGAVWNNVEVKDVTTVCLAGATLTWQQYIRVLEHENFLHAYTVTPDAGLYWRLKKLGVKVLPPKEQACIVELGLIPQPEELGLSLQSIQSSALFLNVSVVEENAEDQGHVSYNQEKRKWNSDVWKEDSQIWQELVMQLNAYRYVLRDLLFDEEANHFDVTFTTNDERFQSIVDNLNVTFVTLGYY